MNKLHFVNQLTKEELNDFLHSIGYQLDDNIVNERTGEKVPSYDVLDGCIMCRCKRISFDRMSKALKLALKLYWLSPKITSKWGSYNFFNGPELVLITDIYCAKLGLGDFGDDNTFTTNKLQEMLSLKFDNEYTEYLKLDTTPEEENEVE